MPYWDTPLSPVPSDQMCIPIRIPNSTAWLQLLMGAIDDLSHEYNWAESASGLTPQQTANIWRKTMYEMVDERCEVMAYPRSAFIPGSLARKLTGAGALTTDQGSTYMLGQRTYIATPAVGNKLEWHFFLAAGLYTMRTVIQRINSSNGCTVDWSIDGELVIDNMSFLGGSPNNIIDTSITIANDGVHSLLFEVVAITGSASIAPVHYIQFVDRIIPA